MRRAAGGPVIVLSIMMGFGSIGCAAIDAGHEGVLVEQPFFFGHGGVDPVPSKTGRVWLAPTTHVVDVDVRPVQYSEHFDIISAENAPVSFDAFMIANVVEGRSPELIARYGPNWYHNNVKEAFRTFVREEVQKYPSSEGCGGANHPDHRSGTTKDYDGGISEGGGSSRKGRKAAWHCRPGLPRIARSHGSGVCGSSEDRSAEGDCPAFTVGADGHHGIGTLRNQSAADWCGQIKDNDEAQMEPRPLSSILRD